MRASTSRRRQHVVHAPAVGRADVHELDEAQHDGRRSRVQCARQRHDLVVVRAALDHHVDLDRREAGGAARRRCPRARPPPAKSTSFMRRNMASSIASRLTVTRCSPASLSAAALRASSEPLVVSVRSSGWPSGVRSAASISTRRSRFLRSSGSPPVSRILRTPARRTGRASAGRSPRSSAARMRQEHVSLVEDLLRHAVAAAEVAAIGDRDAQVAQRPRQCVEQQAGGRDEACGTARLARPGAGR